MALLKKWALIERVKELIEDPDFNLIMNHRVLELTELEKENNYLTRGLKSRIQPDQDYLELNFKLKKSSDSLWIPVHPAEIPENLLNAINQLSQKTNAVLNNTINIEGEKVVISFDIEEDIMNGMVTFQRLERKLFPKGHQMSSEDVRRVHELIDLINHYPVLRSHVLNLMDTKWKPLIQSEIINAK